MKFSFSLECPSWEREVINLPQNWLTGKECKLLIGTMSPLILELFKDTLQILVNWIKENTLGSIEDEVWGIVPMII